MDVVFAHSIWTVMMFVLFIGIVVWAWSGKRKQAFHDAANLPLLDDEPHIQQQKSEEHNNG
jgi:cytochrome c oxidase cbb3-type subunit 4